MESLATDSLACQRCGTFAPLTLVDGRQICEPCRQRHVVPLDRTPLTVRVALFDTLRIVRHLGWRALIPIWIVHVPLVILFHWLEHPGVRLFSGLLTVIADMAILRMTVALTRGERPRMWAALAGAMVRWPVLVATLITVYTAAAVGLIAVVVPAIVFLLGFSLATPIVMMENASPFAAMEESWRRMDGHKRELLGAALVAILFLVVFSVAVAGIQTGLWEIAAALGLPPRPTGLVFTGVSRVFLAPLGWMPLVLLKVVFYVKLRYLDERNRVAEERADHDERLRS